MISQHAFFIVSGIIFGLVALVHALRLVLHWQVKIGQREIPMWVSVLGLIIAAGLCFWALWLLF
jgi:tellurite resistance protein TehA-like permease